MITKTQPIFRTQTAIAGGLRDYLKQLEGRLSLTSPLNVYLAGGMAVYLYTGNRLSTDIDAEFERRVIIPNDLIVDVTLENGEHKSVFLDTNYNSTFALMHENYLDDSILLDLGTDQIKLHVLSPLDLAVSKIARFNDNDKKDIAALVSLGLTTAEEIEQRATSALAGYIGGDMVRYNIRDAVAVAREAKVDAEERQAAAQRLADLPALAQQAGASLTFWEKAMAAIAAHGVEAVDWANVERRTFIESIGENGQDPSSVANAICQHSPGAVTAERQAMIRAVIERMAPGLQARYAFNKNDENKHRRDLDDNTIE